MALPLLLYVGYLLQGSVNGPIKMIQIQMIISIKSITLCINVQQAVYMRTCMHALPISPSLVIVAHLPSPTRNPACSCASNTPHDLDCTEPGHLPPKQAQQMQDLSLEVSYQ